MTEEREIIGQFLRIKRCRKTFDGIRIEHKLIWEHWNCIQLEF